MPRVSLGLSLLPLAHLRSLRPPGCFDAWDFLAKVHGVDVRSYVAALLSVCTYAAYVTGVASTPLSMFDEPRARYGSCVLAARRAPSTLRQGSASTPLPVLSGRSFLLVVVTGLSIFLDALICVTVYNVQVCPRL